MRLVWIFALVIVYSCVFVIQGSRYKPVRQPNLYPDPAVDGDDEACQDACDAACKVNCPSESCYPGGSGRHYLRAAKICSACTCPDLGK